MTLSNRTTAYFLPGSTTGAVNLPAQPENGRLPADPPPPLP